MGRLDKRYHRENRRALDERITNTQTEIDNRVTTEVGRLDDRITNAQKI